MELKIRIRVDVAMYSSLRVTGIIRAGFGSLRTGSGGPSSHRPMTFFFWKKDAPRGKECRKVVLEG